MKKIISLGLIALLVIALGVSAAARPAPGGGGMMGDLGPDWMRTVNALEFAADGWATNATEGLTITGGNFDPIVITEPRTGTWDTAQLWFSDGAMDIERIDITLEVDLENDGHVNIWQLNEYGAEAWYVDRFESYINESGTLTIPVGTAIHGIGIQIAGQGTVTINDLSVIVACEVCNENPCECDDYENGEYPGYENGEYPGDENGANNNGTSTNDNDNDDDDGLMTWIIIGAAGLVLVVGIVAFVVLGKKKQ